MNQKKINLLEPVSRLWQQIFCPAFTKLLKDDRLGRSLIFVMLISFGLIILGENYLLITQSGRGKDFEVGDISDRDYYAEMTFRYIDQESTERVKALRLASVNGIFLRQDQIDREVIKNWNDFRDKFTRVADGGGDFYDSGAFDISLSDSQLNYLLNDKEYVRLFEETEKLISKLLSRGYYLTLDYFQDPSFDTGVIEIVSSHDMTGGKQTRSITEMITHENVNAFLDDEMESLDFEDEAESLVMSLFMFFIRENCFFSRDLTERMRDNVVNDLVPLFNTMEKGEKILGEGEVITREKKQSWEAYGDRINRFKLVPIIKPLIYLTGILILASILICYLPVRINNNANFKLILWTLPLYIFIIILFERIISIGMINSFFPLVPTGFFTLLLSQLIREKKGVLVYSVILALLSFFITSLDPVVFIYALVTGVAGTLVLTGGEKRIDILKSGILLGSVNLSVSLVLDLLVNIPWQGTLIDSAWAFVSGMIYALLVLSLLPLFEHFMNSCTAYRLAELANLNEPMLKRLFIQAAGTYVHSINVAYMAEPACEAIGCNSLLARVASYYHDMGKMDQPSYFIENQNDANKHDELKANLSVAIIKAHVKLGVEKAREMGLPVEVIDIIRQHHGTSVIKFFYDKAEREIRQTGKSSLNRDDFCHFGPRPQSKEAAVVMLADSIEAASRTLKKPSKAKLEKFVWDLIMDRLQSGELNDSGLTLNELEIIKDSFIHVLIGHFHTRIEYPDKKKDGEK